MEERKEKKRKKYTAQTQHSKEKSIMGEFPEKNELHLSHRWHATCERETEEDRKSEGDADGYGEVYQQRCGGGGGVVKRRDNMVREDEEDEVSISEHSIHHRRAVYFGARSRSLIALPLPTHFSGPICCAIFPRRFACSMLK